MLPRQTITYAQLLKEGFAGTEIKKMSASLKLFPTPFKGIYYIPSPEERGAWFIDKPLQVIRKVLRLFLKSEDFYFSCNTAEEFFGIKWTPSNKIHIVNEKRSGRIDLRKRVLQNEKKTTFRAKKIAKILSLYGDLIIFHKTKSIKDAKIKETPYGRFAMRSQIRKDKKKFREK